MHLNFLLQLELEFQVGYPLHHLSFFQTNIEDIRNQVQRVQQTVFQLVQPTPLDTGSTYLPSTTYCLKFLKKFIQFLEQHNLEVLEQLYPTYTCILNLTTVHQDSEWLWKRYKLNFKDGSHTQVLLKESGSLISMGTTGLRTWLASLKFADYLLTYPELISNQTVLELGSGCGYLGLVLAKLNPLQLTLTDFNPDVLKLLWNNLTLNQLQNKVKVQSWDWLQFNQLSLQKIQIDVLLGCDITYEPELLPALVKVLKLCFLHCNTHLALLACTKRNPATFDLFLQLLEEVEIWKICLNPIDVEDRVVYYVEDRLSPVLLVQLTKV